MVLSKYRMNKGLQSWFWLLARTWKTWKWSVGFFATFVSLDDQNMAMTRKVWSYKRSNSRWGGEGSCSRNTGLREALSCLFLLIEKTPFTWLLKICFILPGFNPESSETLRFQKQAPPKYMTAFDIQIISVSPWKQKPHGPSVWDIEIRNLVTWVYDSFTFLKVSVSHLQNGRISYTFSLTVLGVIQWVIYTTVFENWHVIQLVYRNYWHKGKKSDSLSFMPTPLHLF